LETVPRDAEGVKAVVSASRGTVSNVNAYSVKVDTAWRAMFDLAVEGSEPVELRLYLSQGDETLTETWAYQFLPVEPAAG
jgi:glucans biosynthesis protein